MTSGQKWADLFLDERQGASRLLAQTLTSTSAVERRVDSLANNGVRFNRGMSDTIAVAETSVSKLNEGK